ncbi:MAG: hypothetical protein ABGY96_16205 [bacterium]|nr:hypothetical protein [Gammaproteobacteria bacterium]HIL97448.1 hypothetical protein [Pseudomonadales bacterium]
MVEGISQMQALYHPEQDRILFRVNSIDKREFRFWITRRFTVLILKVLKDHMDSDPDISTQETPDTRQAVKTFKQEKAIQEANFEQKFTEGSNDLPLGEDVLLAFKLTYKVEGESLHMGIQPKSGQGINMVLNRKINSSLMQLIVTAAKKADWKLNQPVRRQAGQKGRVIN